MMQKLLFFLMVAVCLSCVHASVPKCREGMQAYLVNYDTGEEIFAFHADEEMFPSSMQKMLLLYLIFDYIKDKDVRKIFYTVSPLACSKGGTTMHLKEGQRVCLDDLINGMSIVSANDGSVCAAEGIYGSEEKAAEAMEQLAHNFGCVHTTVRNTTGLPNAQQHTTPKEIVTIARRLMQDHQSDYYRLSQPSLSFNGYTQSNCNQSLRDTDLGVDGVKTGYTPQAGYGVVFSGVLNNCRLVGVINGCKSKQERQAMARKMLEYGFAQQGCKQSIV